MLYFGKDGNRLPAIQGTGLFLGEEFLPDGREVPGVIGETDAAFVRLEIEERNSQDRAESTKSSSLIELNQINKPMAKLLLLGGRFLISLEAISNYPRSRYLTHNSWSFVRLRDQP